MSRAARHRGYTLLELLLGITIVASLSAIALPSYHRTILKSHRTVARAALWDLANRQEDYRLAHRAFAAQVGSLAGPVDAEPRGPRYLGPNGSWQTSPDANSTYRVEILAAATSTTEIACGPPREVAPGDPMALSAVGIGPQSSDGACQQLVLCFAERPGAKAAFDDQGRSTAATRDTCWGIRGG